MNLSHDCARAAALFAELERERTIAVAESAWLASHLDVCPACSGETDPLSAEIVRALESEAALPEVTDPVFLAAQHAAIMDAVRREPAPAVNAVRLPAPARRPWRQARYALALAAGLALLVVMLRLRDRSGEPVAQLPAAGGEIAQIEARIGEPAREVGAGEEGEVADADAQNDDDGSWLIATNDPFPPSTDISLGTLSDADLDELEEIFPEQG